MRKLLLATACCLPMAVHAQPFMFDSQGTPRPLNGKEGIPLLGSDGTLGLQKIVPQGGTTPQTLASLAAATTSSVPMTGAGRLINVQDLIAAADNIPSLSNPMTLGIGLTVDPTPAIQSALNTYAGKAILWVPPGASYTVGTLQLPSFTHLIIDGTLLLKSGTNNHLLNDVSASNVIIEGSGTLDGNAANQNPVGIAIACVNLQTVTGAIVRGPGGYLHIQNCKNYPINAWLNSTSVDFSYVEASNSGNSMECSTTTRCYMDHLYVHGINDYGLAVYGGVVDARITNSTVNANLAGGIVVLDDSSQPLPNSDILIQGNTVSLNGGNGIFVFNSNTGAFHSHVRIIGNTGIQNDYGGTTNDGNFNIIGCSDCVISDNISRGSGKTSTSTTAVFVGYNIGLGNGMSVQNNRAFDEGNGSTYGLGYQLSGAATRVHMEGNDCTDDQSTITTTFCYSGGFGNNTRGQFLNNSAGSTTGSPFNIGFGNDTQVEMLLRDSPYVSFPSGIAVTSTALITGVPLCAAATTGQLCVVAAGAGQAVQVK